MPRPPGRPAPIPVWPVWNSADRPEFGDCFVQRVVRPVVGFECLQARMELEPSDAVVGDQPAGPSHGGRPAVGIDGTERDQHIWVRGGLVGDLFAGQSGMAGCGGGVDGEDHRRHPLFPVVRGDVFQGGCAVFAGLEICSGGVHQLLVEREAAVGVLFDVHVHVDRGDRIEIYSCCAA